MDLDHAGILTSAQTAAVAELAWSGGDGRLRVRTVTPGVADGTVAFTLTYADAPLAEHLSSNPEVCLAFTDSRMARVGWRPLGVSGRLSVTEDIEGESYCEELLHQELVKYPPGRKLSNSFILRRENWWYIPRFIVTFEPAGEAFPLVRREPANDHALLFWRGTKGIRCAVVSADYREEPDSIYVRPRTEGALPESGGATLYAHDLSVPDMERRISYLASGRLRGGRLVVERREGERDFGRPPSFLDRWREFRELRRRCTGEIVSREPNL